MPEITVEELDNGRQTQNKSNGSVLAMEAVFSFSLDEICPRAHALPEEPCSSAEAEAAHDRRGG